MAQRKFQNIFFHIVQSVIIEWGHINSHVWIKCGSIILFIENTKRGNEKKCKKDNCLLIYYKIFYI